MTDNENAAMVKEHMDAVNLRHALQQVNELRIPVVCRDRCVGQKSQAKLARQLFKTLGLKKIRAKIAGGANCFWVVIILPRMMHDPPIPGQKHDRQACSACRFSRWARDKIEEILGRAFPQHDDRSDGASDYFDFCWSIR